MYVDTIEMTVPAKAEFVPMLRSMIGCVGAMLEFPLDEVEDLRLATSEACGYLLNIAPRARILRVTIDVDEGSIQITAPMEDSIHRVMSEGVDQFITWHILGALTDEASLEWTVEGPVIRFCKRRTRAWTG